MELEIELKAGIFQCVTFCEGEDIGVNGFIRKLDAEVIREILTIESESLFKHDIYSIRSEKDILKVKSKEHEFEVERELLAKLYDHITELQDDIDKLCNSKSFTYQYSLVNKDKSFDREDDEKQRTVIDIKYASDSSFIGRTAMGGVEYDHFTIPPMFSEEPKNEKVLNVSSGQNMLPSPIPVSSTVSNISSLDEFNYLTPVKINQTVTTMLSCSSANDSGFIGHVGMGGDEYDSFTTPPMVSHEPKNENVSNGQNILPSSIPATPSVSNICSLDQFNIQSSTPVTVPMEGNLPSSSVNFEDEFFSAPSKARDNYKGFLQEMLVKSTMEVELPRYSWEKEGSGFTASVEVTISGEVSSYASLVPLKSKKDAEQAAAEKAYNALKESDVGLGRDTEQGDCQKLLYWHNKKQLPEPTYSVVTCSGPHITNFKCTVTYNRNMTIEGPVERNKKLAKKKAASMAWKAISHPSQSTP